MGHRKLNQRSYCCSQQSSTRKYPYSGYKTPNTSHAHSGIKKMPNLETHMHNYGNLFHCQRAHTVTFSHIYFVGICIRIGHLYYNHEKMDEKRVRNKVFIDVSARKSLLSNHVMVVGVVIVLHIVGNMGTCASTRK